MRAQIVADLTACGVAGDECNAIALVALARRDELQRASVRHASQLATASLSAFDWKVHLTVSSDRAATLREPLAMLQLRLQRSTLAPRAAADDVLLELTGPEAGGAACCRAVVRLALTVGAPRASSRRPESSDQRAGQHSATDAEIVKRNTERERANAIALA